MEWIGQHIYDLVARFRNDVYLEGSSPSLYIGDGTGDLSLTAKRIKLYHPVNNGDPSLSIGSSDSERLVIQTQYQGTATQTAEIISFASFTESATANYGRFHFSVDGTQILRIQDGGLDLRNSSGISIDGTNILTDSSGTATLSNIDALDATTVSTLNAALTAGDITGVTIVTDDENIGETASATNAGIVELATTAETTTGTDADRAVTPDGLKDGYQGSANVTTLGTIGTGTWQGTAIATDQQKHLACFKLAGYGTCDGTNYEIPEIMTDTNAPFEHNTSAGADGLTALAVSVLLRAAGHAMPYAGTLKKWLGWAASSGSGATYVALFRYRPDPSSSSAVSLVLLDEQSFTAAGNNTVVAINQTSFTDADVAVGDIIITGIKGVNNKTAYFTSTLEIEWD